VTVVIADDHDQIRAQTRAIVEGGGFVVVAEASDATAAVVAVQRHRPDVCLLDIRMPGGGIEAAKEIAVRAPETAVVMVTVARGDQELFDALRAGARGYLLKGTDPATMVAALRAVLDGEPALSPGVAMRILDQFRNDRSRRVHVPGQGDVELSPREAEVLGFLREGLTTAQIAGRMHVAPVTVRTHIASLLRKLRVRDRGEAVRIFD
jgi:DNA-binding NarL/FixJ family response regulator